MTKAFVVSFTLIVLFFGYNNSYSEVIRLQNGEIYFGKVVSADSDGITVESFGKTIKLPQKDILRTDKDLSAIKNQQVVIILKDGSVLKGKIQNYDDEIGVLVETELGQTTITVSSIKQIYDAAKKKFFTGSLFSIGIAGGYYIPLLGLAPDFKNSFNFSVFGEYNTELLRGLSFGGEISVILVDYKPDESEFSIYSLQPYASYKFLQLKNSSSFIRYFTPFISLGIGGAYIVKKTSSTERSEIDPIVNFKVGLDINIVENVGARIYTGIESIMQKHNSFNRVLFNAGVSYSL